MATETETDRELLELVRRLRPLLVRLGEIADRVGIDVLVAGMARLEKVVNNPAMRAMAGRRPKGQG